MKEAKSDILNLSNSKNLSLPKSFQKIKKSKNIQNRNNKKSNSKLKKETIKKKFSPLYIINSQLQKHNSNPFIKNIMIINDIIDTKTNHYLAIFKDYLITDYIDEFLKRYFSLNECEELIPKFYVYYKNYLKFFCRGFFIDFQANKIIQEYGEYQAELYYNKNYGMKDKKSKKNKNDENINCNSSNNISNNSNYNYNLNKLKILFTESIKNSINRVENSKLIRNYIYKYNTNEISNILYNNKNETLTLNDDTKVYNNDNIITNENTLINIIDNMIHKKRKEKTKKNKNKNMKNKNNDKNIVNIYKNLLNQSPIKSSRNLNFIKSVPYNKTSRKVSSIKIFNKNIPMIIKNRKYNNNISNELKDSAKTPIYVENPKTATKNNQIRNSKINNSNLFMKSNLTQKSHYRNTSKIISSRLGENLITTKNANNKFSSFNTNLIIDNQNNKKKIKFNGLYSRNIDNYLLSTSSSRNLKNIFMYSYHSNKNLNNNNIFINNSKKANNRIKHYQYINYKNKTQLKNNSNNKHKQSYSLSNSNSIFNNFHININNNIMLLNNNNNTHYNSNKNNFKSKSNKRIDDIKLTLNKQIKSRNIGIGFDLKKYKTEKNNNNINNIKNRKNICSSIRKYIYLVKTRSKSKDKISKNKEILIRNKSNLYNNHSCFKIKKIEDSDIMPSLKIFKKLNNSNKNLNLNKVQKTNVIFDYKRK